ncbi:MAG: ATP-binding cassette domain-containing protein [Alphaproteobacteria bacterium]
MLELIVRLLRRPMTTALLLAATLVVNLLMLAPPIFVMQVLNRYVAFGVDGTLLVLTVGALFALAMEFAFRWVRLRLAAVVSVQPDEDVAIDSARGLIETKLGTLRQLPKSLRRRFSRDVDLIQSAYSPPILMALLDLPFTLILFTVLFFISPVLAFLAMTASGLLILVAVGQAAIQAANQPVPSDISPFVDDMVDRPETVRAFNGARMLIRYWTQTMRLQQRKMRRVAVIRGVLQSISMSMTALTTIAIVGVGAVLVVRQELDIGVLIAANILGTRAVAGVSRAAMTVETLAHARKAKQRIRDLRRRPTETGKGSALGAYSGRFALTDVVYAYPGQSSPLFDQLTINLDPGDILVVHGANGTGKSTLAEMALGLVEPLRGAVVVDGLDMRQVAIEWWRKQVCYLPQNPDFLNASVADNLRTLNPDLDDEGLNRAIQMAGCRHLISAMPNGFETDLGVYADTLSPGDRKRLALARALVSNGRLAVLDEPLECLDQAGRASVVSVLQAFANDGRTMIVCSTEAGIIQDASWFLDLDASPPVLTEGPRRKKQQQNKEAAE